MNQELVVTKANKLVEASYRLNVSEQRVLALLVAQIAPDDEEFKPYSFKVADLEALIGTKNNKAYREVKELTMGLIKKGLQIQEPNRLVQVSWLSSAVYYDGAGTVELKFTPELKPYLLKLQERFTSYKIGNLVKLRSRYSVRLYELLKQYETLGKRSFDLAELRHVLGLVDGELGRWVDFKRFVLEVAKRELPQKTDIGFSYTVRKHVRTVAFVDFKIWHVDHDKPSNKSSKKASKKAGKKKPGSQRQQAEQCYREHKCGTTCDVQDIATLNVLPTLARATV
jgi:plasmid replication initiation protein